MLDDAKRRLEIGARFPFDATDAWRNSEGIAPPLPVDWAHSAARGVLADLTDRRGVKNLLDALDEELRIELVASLAAIIRAAKSE
jgi:hypothetical protein